MTVLACAAATAAAGLLAGAAGGSPGSHLRTLRLVDRTRVAHLQTGAAVPRTLVTIVRIPPRGRPPFPLVVFAHGFDLVPSDYGALLHAWTQAGYVVAAPVFPVESATAAGGPSRADLPNEPGDLRFLIGRLTAPRGPLHGIVDPRRVAVAGQSDGGIAALSAAADRRWADPQIDAAIVMSGAPLPGFVPARRTPPLLAVQGTADPFNAPATTAAYVRQLRPPTFLLWLEGAGHKEPYTTRDRWSGVVVRATLAFLAHELRGRPLRPLLRAGRVPGVSSLQANP